MSRPIGPEGAPQDLSRIIGQVNSLREQRALAGRTDAEYRATITNHVHGLRAICSEPDVQEILKNEGPYGSFPPQLGHVFNIWDGRRVMITSDPDVIKAKASLLPEPYEIW